MLEGIINQINVKPDTPGEHGLPKKSVPNAVIATGGVDGDYNRYRQVKKGGEPDMAVMILSQEILDDLNKEGWPVQAGDLGENFTISGLTYSKIEPDQKFRVGSALIQISFKCDPCTNLDSLPYVGKEKSSEFIKTLMNRRGWYARVQEEGIIHLGDEFVLEK